MNNYAFIDAQNVHLSIRSQGWSIDWKRFRVYLQEHYNITTAYLFLGYIEGNNSLYEKLQKAGFICIWKPVLKYKDGTIKGNVDAEMVLHTMIQFPNFDKALIVTGDGDFYCLVQYLLQQNKLKTVLVPDRNKCSALLKKFAKKNIAFMNDLKNKVGFR
ncbi:MAG: NYN domain-containing protein [Candidatus Zambryskibacteria bacterium]|nr:NYN domain-containing protein [Candidatus Zambryskibacteria bacterium]